MGAFRYGILKNNRKRDYDMIGSLEKRVERYKKTGVLINNTDDIFVISEWFGPSIIKKPEPGEYAEDGQQTTSGTGIKTSLGIQRRK